MQNHYSLCYREEEREMNKYCNLTGVGLIPWSPLYRGALARPVDAPSTARSDSMKNHPLFGGSTDADKVIIGRVQEVAQKKGWKVSLNHTIRMLSAKDLANSLVRLHRCLKLHSHGSFRKAPSQLLDFRTWVALSRR